MMPCAAGLWRSPSRIIRLGALATKTRTAEALAHHPAHRHLPSATELTHGTATTQRVRITASHECQRHAHAHGDPASTGPLGRAGAAECDSQGGALAVVGARPPHTATRRAAHVILITL